MASRSTRVEVTCPGCRSVYLLQQIRTPDTERDEIGCEHCAALLSRSQPGVRYVACVLLRRGAAPGER